MSSWCPHCSDDRPTTATASQPISIHRPTDGGQRIRRFTSCSACGRILKDRPYHKRGKGKANSIDIIHEIATAALNLPSSSSAVIIDEAHRIFIGALENEEEIFARKGHRAKTHVAAACLYVALRRHRQPYMLIHLSDYLGVTVYVLAAVFVALSTLLTTSLSIEWAHVAAGSSSSFIDPSLFMHRISSRLLGRKDAEVAAAALRILSLISRRDWMLTTHKHVPIRFCSAALYIAAAAHDNEERISKSEVVRVVRAEMEAMESADGSGQGLTMDEFVSRVTEIGSNLPISSKEQQRSEEEDSGLVCKHKNSRRQHCRYGLCRHCYHVFVRMSKGCILQQLPEAKALTFQNAKRQKIEHEEEDNDDDQELVTSDDDSSSSSSLLLDDIDDRDINTYINTEEEKQYKTIIWELMHQEYLDEQSAKNMAAAAVLSAITNGDAVKARGEKKQRREGTQRRKDTTAEGKSKENRLSSRINYEVLSQLYQEQDEQSHMTKTDNDGVVDEQKDNKVGNGEDLDGDRKSLVDNESDDYFGDYDEGGGYSFADDNEEYADDDFGF